MAYSFKNSCRHCSLFILFMLLLQVCNAQYDFSKVDGWLKDNLNELGGRAVMLVYKDGKIVYSKAENDLSGKQKFVGKRIAKKTGKDADEVLQDFTDQTKINIASCSKWLTAALVMTFVDEGKLQPGDSIGKFLPVMTMNGKGNITVLDCLSHLTGIHSESREENKDIASGNSMDEVINKIALLPMESTPGESFHYSSIGLQIAAAIIEKISGQDFETLFQERIARPCNMTNTDFGHKKVPLAAGGARSTAADYMNFLKMILAKGNYDGKKILSDKAITQMQQNHTYQKNIIYSPAEAGSWGYGLGEWVMQDVKAAEVSSAVTSPGLFGSFPWVDNERQYAAMLLVFNVKSKGRHEKYTALKQLVDNAIQK